MQPYTCSLPPFIVCRFILNLRQTEPAGSYWTSETPSPSLHFAGSMGNSLQFGGGDDDEEEEEEIVASAEADASMEIATAGSAGGTQTDVV